MIIHSFVTNFSARDVPYDSLSFVSIHTHIYTGRGQTKTITKTVPQESFFTTFGLPERKLTHLQYIQ